MSLKSTNEFGFPLNSMWASLNQNRNIIIQFSEFNSIIGRTNLIGLEIKHATLITQSRTNFIATANYLIQVFEDIVFQIAEFGLSLRIREEFKPNNDRIIWKCFL